MCPFSKIVKSGKSLHPNHPTIRDYMDRSRPPGVAPSPPGQPEQRLQDQGSSLIRRTVSRAI